MNDNDFNSLGKTSESRGGSERRARLELRLAFVDQTEQYNFNVFSNNLQFSPEFPAGIVGTRYEFSFPALDPQTVNLQRGRCVLESVDGFDELGLTCELKDGARLIVSGTPTKEFDGVVSLRVCRREKTIEARAEGDMIVERALKILSAGRADKPDSAPISTANTLKGLPIRQIAATPEQPRGVYEPVDPFTLWEQHDPPADAPYQTPHMASKGVKWDSCSVLAASRRGRSHEHEGLFRDDSFEIYNAFSGTEWHVFAVADGAGSAKYSREGARIACQTVVKELRDLLTYKAYACARNIRAAFEQNAFDVPAVFDASAPMFADAFNVMAKAVYSACAAVDKEAKLRAATEPTKLRDYNTTLLACAVKRFDFGFDSRGWAVLSYWIGDGGFAVYRPNGREETILLGAPDGGEYAGETRFLTTYEEMKTEAILARTRLTLLRDFDAIVMATDGVTDPFFESDSKLRDHESWRRFWTEKLPAEAPGAFDRGKRPEERAKALLDGLYFKAKGYHDDRTILAVVNER